MRRPDARIAPAGRPEASQSQVPPGGPGGINAAGKATAALVHAAGGRFCRRAGWSTPSHAESASTPRRQVPPGGRREEPEEKCLFTAKSLHFEHPCVRKHWNLRRADRETLGSAE